MAIKNFAINKNQIIYNDEKSILIKLPCNKKCVWISKKFIHFDYVGVVDTWAYNVYMIGTKEKIGEIGGDELFDILNSYYFSSFNKLEKPEKLELEMLNETSIDGFADKNY